MRTESNVAGFPRYNRNGVTRRTQHRVRLFASKHEHTQHATPGAGFPHSNCLPHFCQTLSSSRNRSFGFYFRFDERRGAFENTTSVSRTTLLHTNTHISMIILHIYIHILCVILANISCEYEIASIYFWPNYLGVLLEIIRQF